MWLRRAAACAAIKRGVGQTSASILATSSVVRSAMFQRHAATKAKTVSSAATPSGPEAGAVAPAALSVVYTTGSQLATSSSTSSSSSSSLQAVSFFLTSDALSLLRVGATSTEKGDSGGTTVETILGGAECALFDGAAAFAPASFQDFKADAGECLWLYPTAAATSKGAAKNKTYPRILLVGLGRATSVTLASYRSASYKAISSFQALLLTRVGLILPAPPLEQQQRFFDSHYQGEVVGNVARVATLSEHYFRKYLSQKTIEAKKRKPIERIEIIDLQQRVAAGSSSKSKASAASSASMSDHSRIVSTHTAIARATLRARDWANERGDVANTEWMERQARSVAKAGKLKITVLQDAELEKEGLHLIRAVGQAATHKARLVLLEYHGHSDSKAPPIALVGKGITFDTGGLLIKPRGGMEGMHIDKAGSAAVLGVMSAVSELGLKENIVGVLALAENAISHAAYKPLAILPSAAGSVEVSDTDAEGRLVLADALTYVQRTYRPDRIIDIATLTGAAVVALGEHCAALFSNSDSLSQSLLDAGEATGERLWRMPMMKEHEEELKATYADFKNCASTRYGGACVAASFLQKYIQPLPSTGTSGASSSSSSTSAPAPAVSWAHLDVAGPAMASKQKEWVCEGGTGFGTALMLQYLLQVQEAGAARAAPGGALSHEEVKEALARAQKTMQE